MHIACQAENTIQFRAEIPHHQRVARFDQDLSSSGAVPVWRTWLTQNEPRCHCHPGDSTAEFLDFSLTGYHARICYF